MIVCNELRSAFSSWPDRLVALAILLIALVAARSSLSDLPFILAASAVAALAAATGAGAARAIGRRLDFHAQEGVLAAHALTEDVRQHYILPIHALVCGVVSICAAVARPEGAVFAPIFYLIGASICHLARRLATEGGVLPRASLLRLIRRLLQRPASGALAAIPALLPLLLLGSIEPGPMAGFIGLLSAAIALPLALLDYDVIRFMSASGYSARRIIGIHARSLLIFVVLAAILSLALSGGLVAIVVCGVVLAVLVLMTARILAYRVHSKRTAETLVSLYAGVAGLTAFATPLLLPIVAIAILWHLYRRSIPATWLLT